MCAACWFGETFALLGFQGMRFQGNKIGRNFGGLIRHVFLFGCLALFQFQTGRQQTALNLFGRVNVHLLRLKQRQ